VVGLLCPLLRGYLGGEELAGVVEVERVQEHLFAEAEEVLTTPSDRRNAAPEGVASIRWGVRREPDQRRRRGSGGSA
jgi:hypothetical protein